MILRPTARSTDRLSGSFELHIVLTKFTPETAQATATALFFVGHRVYEAVQLHDPLNVSTLISAELNVGSLKMAAFTLVVSTVSLI